MSASDKDQPGPPPQSTVPPPISTMLKCHPSESEQSQSSIAPVPEQLSSMLADEVLSLFASSKPIPVQHFMDEYFPQSPSQPRSEIPIFPQDLFKRVREATSELEMYEPLRDALDTILRVMYGTKEPNLTFNVTNKRTQKLTEELYSIAPDLGACQRVREAEGVSLWKDIELPIEVKYARSADPVSNLDAPSPIADFSSGESDIQPVVIWSHTRDKAMSHIADYSRCMTYVHARTRSYTLGIYDKFARIFVWDRSAVAFSEAFDYIDHTNILAEFLFRFSNADRATRGLDPTVSYTLSLLEQEKVSRASAAWNALRKRLRSEHKVELQPISGPSCRITVPTAETDIVFLTLGRPISVSYGIFSRGTRCWFGFEASTELDANASNAVLIKDSWIQEGRAFESTFYDELQKPGLANGIAHYMTTAKFHDERLHITSNHVAAKVPPRKHVRNVLKTLGRPLSNYQSTKELIEGIRSAVEGHHTALTRGVLHRDISEHNIMLSFLPSTGPGSGFIIDFDLSIFVDPEKRVHNEQWDLTGTVQFMALARLRRDKIVHEPWHDLESFFWVLLFVVAQHTSTTLSDSDMAKEKMIDLFEPARAMMVETRSIFFWSSYVNFTVHGNEPLTRCIRNLAETLGRAYLTQREIGDGKVAVFPTHKDFQDILSTALAQDGWPCDDLPRKSSHSTVIHGTVQPFTCRTLRKSASTAAASRKMMSSRPQQMVGTASFLHNVTPSKRKALRSNADEAPVPASKKAKAGPGELAGKLRRSARLRKS